MVNELDEQIRKDREGVFKAEFKNELMLQILPKMLIDDTFGGMVDAAFGIDRKSLIAQSLRELATDIERNYTLDDIARGLYVEREEPARSADES